MQSENRIFDDLARFLNGMAGTMAGMGREAEEKMRERAREFLGGVDFVSREEFQAVKAMAAKAREEAERLAQRVAALEGMRAPGGDSSAAPGAMPDEAPPAEPHPAAPKKDEPGRKPAEH